MDLLEPALPSRPCSRTAKTKTTLIRRWSPHGILNRTRSCRTCAALRRLSTRKPCRIRYRILRISPCGTSVTHSSFEPETAFKHISFQVLFLQKLDLVWNERGNRICLKHGKMMGQFE